MLGWKFNCDSVVVKQVYLCLQDGLRVNLHRLANLLKWEVKDDRPLLLRNGVFRNGCIAKRFLRSQTLTS
jgi:hypothetical protein